MIGTQLGDSDERRDAEALKNGGGAFPTVSLEGMVIPGDILDLVPGEFALKRQILPIRRFEGGIEVAIGSVESLQALDEMEALTGLRTKPVLADANDIRQRIEEHFIEQMLEGIPAEDATQVDTAEVSDLADLTKLASEAAVVQMVNLIFAQAVRDGASDIHIEPAERHIRIRYRVDGMLRDVMRPPKRMHAAVVSRIKILGEMNIAERRLPQDGRIKLNIAGRSIDVRVSTVPTVFGERAVMRILDKGTAMLGLQELGMQADTLERFHKLISMPYGIILSTGPTGAGKSTTLYASLQEIWSPATNIITIEDPVEYQVAGISQIPVRPTIGLTFANGLRSIVRQDPDVIMVGEIRDHETAEISIHAALTGHLVFSTLHTNDSAGAVARLLDMGVEPFLVASSLIGVVAQRLVRKVCTNCAHSYTPSEATLAALGFVGEQPTFVRGSGCDKCQSTGFRGRVGLFELFVVDDVIRKMTVDRASAETLRAHAIQHQRMRSLLEEGRMLVRAGKTTPEEVLRVCQREDLIDK